MDILSFLNSLVYSPQNRLAAVGEQEFTGPVPRQQTPFPAAGLGQLDAPMARPEDLERILAQAKAAQEQAAAPAPMPAPAPAPPPPPPSAAPQAQSRGPVIRNGGWSSAAFDDMGSAGNPAVQAILAAQSGPGGYEGAAGMSAPTSAPRGPVMPGSGRGGISEWLSGGKNGTATANEQWLVSKGMNPAKAQIVSRDPRMFTAAVLEMTETPKPIEINGRLVHPQTYEVLADFSDSKGPKTTVIDGKLVDQETGRVIGDYSKPERPEYITGRDGSIFRADDKGLQQVYGGKPDQTTDVQEYEYARQQGYGGSFTDWQIEQKRAGASQVNIDQKAEGAFDKKLAESQATVFTEMATEGLNANADLAVLGELEGLLGENGGTFTGLSGYLAKYGIGGENVGDLQAAEALINKLVPTQRQPGSGTMSDRDVELFKRSLPSLWNAPGGNQKILGVMRGLAEYKRNQGNIAAAVVNGEMSRQDAMKALRELPNPLAGLRGEKQPDAAMPLPLPPSAAPGQTAPAPGPANPRDGVIDWRDFIAPGRKK